MIAHIAPEHLRLARLAGALYLIQMATGVFGFLVRSSFTVQGNVTQTAENIRAAEGLFRLSILTDVVTLSAVLSLTWALYVILNPVNRHLAVLAVVFRGVENAVLGSGTVYLLVALALLRQVTYQQTFGDTHLHGLARLAITTHAQAYTLGFVFLGLGSAVFAVLLLRSGYVARLLAGWGVFASLLLALGSFGVILFPQATSLIQMASFAPMGIYEVALGVSLLLARTTPAARVREA